MKQVSQNYKECTIKVEEVEKPALKPGGVLVKSINSVISIGTEGTKVKEGKMSYLNKARSRPDQVKKVLQLAQQQGLAVAYQKAMNRLDSLLPLGYSLSGVITDLAPDVEEFFLGQRVACAGAGYANHAEFNFIPKNLVVPVPNNVSMEYAAFTTIGSIAMHGYRQSKMQIGETACVIGLGLVGQLLVQILHAAGIQVIGVDIIEERCKLALEVGAAYACRPHSNFLFSSIHNLTNGRGVDCVFLTAGGSSSEPVELSVKIARDRANLIVVGKTKMELPWQDYYEKEINVIFSRSYGPGRYDPNYEEKGIDYPIGYIRWPEKRNMESFLNLVSQGKVKLDRVISSIHPLDEAEKVFLDLAEDKLDGIGILFNYSDPENNQSKSLPVYDFNSNNKNPDSGNSSLRLGLIGIGNYASTMLLPYLAGNKNITLVEAAAQKGLSVKDASRKFPFQRTSTNYKSMLEGADIDAVIIATRHSSHASLTVEALSAGKAVFVEKPLALNTSELESLRKTIIETGNDRLQVGFNRRFCPLIKDIAEVFQNIKGPLVINYRVNAGQLEPGSWYLDPSEGSRFTGEAGHFFDVMSFLANSRPVSVTAKTIHPEPVSRDDLENIVVTVTYENGSLGNLLYLTRGSIKSPKEIFEISGGGCSAAFYNFKYATVYEKSKTRKLKNKNGSKGQKQELEAFIYSIKSGTDMPVNITSLFDSTLTTFAAIKSCKTGREVFLSDFWQIENPAASMELQ